MKSKINRDLVKGSLTLILAFGFFNFFHFLFQFFMARMLTLADYGILATLFSIIYILMVFTESVQTILAKYSANEKDHGKLKSLFIRSENKALKASILLYLVYLIIAIPLSFVLKINYFLISLNGLAIFMAFLLPISRGVMQGREKFGKLSLNMVFESAGRLLFGVLFVIVGWKVYGAVIGVLLGSLVAFLFSFIQLKGILSVKEKKFNVKGIYDYAKPTFFIMTLIVVFYSLDVLIARIFFSPEVAGSYALASILGKIIFWGTLPISKAMFPMSADEKKPKSKSANVFSNSLVLLFGGVIGALAVFALFPDLIVRIFSGKVVPQAAGILFYVGLAFSFISLANLLLLYRLSIGKIKGHQKLWIFVVLEIVLLSFFSSNLFVFSVAFVTSAVAFLWGVLFLLEK